MVLAAHSRLSWWTRLLRHALYLGNQDFETGGMIPLVGTELVINGGFGVDSDWSKGTGWAISSGVATKSAGAAANLAETITFVAGAVYKVVWTITAWTAGRFRPRIIVTTNVDGTLQQATGTFVEDLRAAAGNTTFVIQAVDATSDGSIDNVSLKRVS